MKINEKESKLKISWSIWYALALTFTIIAICFLKSYEFCDIPDRKETPETVKTDSFKINLDTIGVENSDTTIRITYPSNTIIIFDRDKP